MSILWHDVVTQSFSCSSETMWKRKNSFKLLKVTYFIWIQLSFPSEKSKFWQENFVPEGLQMQIHKQEDSFPSLPLSQRMCFDQNLIMLWEDGFEKCV